MWRIARSATAGCAVEQTLDAAHALMSHGIDRYPGKKQLDLRAEEKRARQSAALHEESAFNDLWRTVPTGPVEERRAAERRAPPQQLLGLPQENLLYFLEKTAPRLQPWQRELLRIVRHIAQYFYPQSQTKVMNEGTRDLRSLSHHEPRCTSRAGSPTAISSNSCSRTPTSCSSPISTIRASPASIPMRSALR